MRPCSTAGRTPVVCGERQTDLGSRGFILRTAAAPAVSVAELLEASRFVLESPQMSRAQSLYCRMIASVSYDSGGKGRASRHYERGDFDEAVAKLQTLHDEGVVTFERWGEPFLADFFDGITGMSDTPAGLRDMYRNLRALFECPCNDDWKMVCEQKFGDHPALSTLGAHLDAAVGF